MGGCITSAASGSQAKGKSTEWPLKADATRTFNQADSNGNGTLDVSELSKMLSSNKFARVRLRRLDRNLDGAVSLREWLTYVKGVYSEHPEAAIQMLQLYERQLEEANKAAQASVPKQSSGSDVTEAASQAPAVAADLDMPILAEAVRIFQLADANQKGTLDERELALEKLLKSKEFAKHWMIRVDTDRNGEVSEAEWLAYWKTIYDTSPESAAEVLKLHEKHIAEARGLLLFGAQSECQVSPEMIAEAGSSVLLGAQAECHHSPDIIAEARGPMLLGAAAKSKSSPEIIAEAHSPMLLGAEAKCKSSPEIVVEARVPVLLGAQAECHDSPEIIAEAGSPVLVGAQAGCNSSSEIIAKAGCPVLLGAAATCKSLPEIVAGARSPVRRTAKSQTSPEISHL
jgi:Ca2+-binding EF-hand superfamily protein